MPGRRARSASPTRSPPTSTARASGSTRCGRYSRRLQAGSEPWPDCLLLLGDQVYADEVVARDARASSAAAATRREPPGEEVADFEEYTRLYREAWSDPDIRWLLSTVPSTMIFDDHDVHDDWNISEAWVRDIRAQAWWDERIVGAFMAYWIYQHLGNLAPPELAEEPLLAAMRGRRGRRPAAARASRAQADREIAASRWAFHRDFGRSRLVVVDSRAARVLADGRRDMVDDERVGVDRRARPRRLRPPGHREHAAGVHARRASTTSRRGTRRSAPAPGAARGVASASGSGARSTSSTGRRSSARSRAMVELLRELSRRGRGDTPAGDRTLIGGDVHTAYVAEVSLGARQRQPRRTRSSARRSATRSTPRERRVVRLRRRTAAPRSATRGLARAAGVRPSARRLALPRAGPTFDNSIAVLELDERAPS